MFQEDVLDLRSKSLASHFAALPDPRANAPEIISILRHVVLNLLRLDVETKGSIRSKRMLASLDPTYRLKAILGFTPDGILPGYTKGG